MSGDVDFDAVLCSDLAEGLVRAFQPQFLKYREELQQEDLTGPMDM
jgi:hypothetical protein